MTAAATPMVPVISGSVCLGFVRARGRIGFEAFNAGRQSIGIFADEHAAIAAIMSGKPPLP